MIRRLALVAAAMAIVLGSGPTPARAQDAIGPVVFVETSKGTFSFETFPNEAPATVAHIVALVKSGFYDGQRVHRVIPTFLVQFGDPQSKDLAKRELWGRGAAAASGKPIGVAEISTRRRHDLGAVGMAHLGDPAKADSQIYVTLAPRHDLDLQYVVFGQVTSGQEVPARLQAGDAIVRMYVKE